MVLDPVPDKESDVTRSLLVIDGDSFAHRAYHGVPKSVKRRGNKGGGAILGFANFLLRLYAQEKPRAVLVGWDTLDAPTFTVWSRSGCAPASGSDERVFFIFDRYGFRPI